jgi:phosphatidylglycerol---prolipoprotein diacylglyceryl transferase
MLLEINWNVNPQIFKIGEFEIRYYGLLFALGFIIGQRVLVHIFKKEGKPESDVDTLTMYMVLATVIGARVGHYIFYEYHSIPTVGLGTWLLEMITPPYSGLASHGAILSIFPALYFYARHKKDQSYLWITDRMAITVAIAGFCIRMGNFMNSEILGKPSNVPWAVNFMQDSDYLRVKDTIYAFKYPLLPRHPAQLYESLSCLVLFFIMFAIWNKYKAKTPTGLLTGLFMIWVFTLRFFYEFLKENQTVWEQGMTLNTGQLLSIPAVLFGIAVWYFGSRYDKKKALEAGGVL